MRQDLLSLKQQLTREPWLMLPDALTTLNETINAALKGQLSCDSDDECVDDNAPLVSNGVAIIPVNGAIGIKLGEFAKEYLGMTDLEDLAYYLKTYRDNPFVTQIVLEMNSPGGCVVGLPEVAELIKKVDGIKPVYAYTNTLCASAAYYIAANCRNVVNSPSSYIGAIGTYRLLPDATDAYKQAGIKINEIVSEGSTFKTMGADYRPMTDDERGQLQARVDQINADFKDSVNASRAVDPVVFESLVYRGKDAIAVGLSDGLVNDLDEFLGLINAQPVA